MAEEEKTLTLEAPGEWMLQKLFGPTFDELGEDLKKVYAKGRDKLIKAASKKVENPEDGKRANLRVTHDVLWNGAFTDDEVCAEYFGGVLASSRTEDGKNDASIQFVELIKSLSSRQLRLHYTIYRCLNLHLVSQGKPVNVGQSTEIQQHKLWFSTIEFVARLDLQIDTDLTVLHRQGLLQQYQMAVHELPEYWRIPFIDITPTTFGVLLYAVAHNRLEKWREFDRVDFGGFSDIPLPEITGTSREDFVNKTKPEGRIQVSTNLVPN